MIKLFMSFSGCGGIFQATSGEIHSPNYPEPYNNNTDCSWIIQVDHSHRIRLNFTDFDIEDHHSCNYDNVAVSNNRNFKHFLNESGEMLAKEEAYCAIESAVSFKLLHSHVLCLFTDELRLKFKVL